MKFILLFWFPQIPTVIETPLASCKRLKRQMKNIQYYIYLGFKEYKYKHVQQYLFFSVLCTS